MTRTRQIVIALLVAMALTTPRVVGAQAPAAQGTPTVLKVTVTLSRFTGEKKTSSLPFVLMLVAGDERSTTVQMSSSVPVPQTSVVDGKATPSYSYQNFGTNISASAKMVDAASCNLSISISDSQMNPDGVSSAPELKGLPRTQNFTSSPRLILRDGTTVSYNAGTDKFTGEIVKVDVTMNIVK